MEVPEPAPVSRRGLAKLEPSLMFDFKRQIGDYVARNGRSEMIDITSSVNRLMLDEIEEYANKHVKIDFRTVLPYGGGLIQDALKLAVANFINRYFKPSKTICSSHILVTNGVTSLLELTPYTLCDIGEGIMYPTPSYGMFRHNLQSRSGLEVIEVPADDFDQFLAGNAENLIERFDTARIAASKRGIHVKVLLITNPHNPLGRCYSRHTLIKLAQFCSKYRLHLVSDEIYAMSTFSHPEQTTVEAGETMDQFTSALTIQHEVGVIENNIHIFYGASKDFGLGGLRLGMLITRNTDFLETTRRLTMVATISIFSATFFTQLLNDNMFLDRYFQTYQERLQSGYLQTTTVLKQHNIPFSKTNAGLFLWIDLSQWLGLHGNKQGNTGLTPEMEMTNYLLSRGVFLQPGEAFYSPARGWFRLVYTSEPQNVATGLQKLIHALAALRPFTDGAEITMQEKDIAAVQISPLSIA